MSRCIRSQYTKNNNITKLTVQCTAEYTCNRAEGLQHTHAGYCFLVLCLEVTSTQGVD